MKHFCRTIPFVFLGMLTSFAQTNTISYKIESQAIATSTDQLPFWFSANQYGSIPMAGISASAVGRLQRNYHPTKKKLFDWGIGVEGRANTNLKKSELLVIQSYAKVRLAMFEVKAGRWRQQVGLTDTLLTSGSFSISGNAPGIPQIQLSIPEYYSLPILNGFISLKGSFSHGWLGTLPIREGLWVPTAKTWFHHKSLYGRLGRSDSKLKLYGGFNHQAFWGSEPEIFGANFTMNKWESFRAVVFGNAWADSKVGNHLGSIDFAAEYNTNSTRWKIYRQFFYEVGALAHLANLLDGLNGISLHNLNSPRGEKGFQWKKILFEVFYSANQAGLLSSPSTPTGVENYYNHTNLYTQGWSYLQRGIGNPLITPAHEAREGLVNHPSNYFINNRVLALHGGMTGTWSEWSFMGKTTVSYNRGTYATSGEPYRGMGGAVWPSTLKFHPVWQCSALLSIEKSLNKRNGGSGYWGVDLALDSGGLRNQSLGAVLKLGIRQ